MILIKQSQAGTNLAVVVDDDGKTAYAYLLDGQEIVGDVWLYNCAEAPEEPEWTDPSRSPFANSAEYCVEETFTPVEDETEIQFEWSTLPGTPPVVRILIRDQYHAKLTHGGKPGSCRLAKKNGPLALVLLP